MLKNLNKIATHNSATGERGKGFLSFFVALFSKCQSKTIKLLYESGCRYFDIRVKDVEGTWVCKHGLWTSKRSANDILKELNNYGVYVSLTYCGKCDKEHMLMYAINVENNFPNIKLTTINIKKPKWTCIKQYYRIPYYNSFKILDGSSWHTYIPIPWLWKKIYYSKTDFNDKVFKMVDFL